MERKRCILMSQSKLLETVEIVQRRLNPALQITRLIGTRYDQRKNLNKEVATKLKEYFGETLLTTLSTSACRHCYTRSRERGGSRTSNRGVSLCLREKGGVMSHQLEDLYAQIQALQIRERLELLRRIVADLQADVELQEEFAQWEQLSDEALERFEHDQ